MTSSSVLTSSAKNGLNVATKTHDGGATAAKRPRNSARKQDDPFMYYSNQETRMSALLLSNDSGDNEEQVALEFHERKTRISFELHPSLLLEDLLPDNDQGLPQDEDDIRGDLVLQNLQRMLRGLRQ
mmetsp:Transcript_15708/g.22340  ORF Transcript_15708/g.22340 Transcript_15708/m.22340 type:complete len:127 (-) Transcript_15708:115-495(-)|eukprot:CAMPEP_0201686042 /NCGR_PEP_ID=MMETSP0578-20130828/624_1 /ASSEMBLY_ACC=CAM_ASM_000663 /TAXON_ID=267565 /ORGANISM="Skeletonema grethea, Strain CCMP 1804" /LENGTH=126 /DNA_ID=CAMNT_0048170033 /DNA_START=100 /DNA_END=480 /DNA_ORIENTATION=-